MIVKLSRISGKIRSTIRSWTNRSWRLTTSSLKKARVIAGETWVQMKEAQLLMAASSLAYTTILSIIPVMAVSFAIFQAFGGLEKIYDVVEPLILSNLAEGTGDQVIDNFHVFIQNTHASVVGAGGLIALVFTSMSMLFNIEKAINQVWGSKLNRNMFQRVSVYWLFITLGPLALSIVVGFTGSTATPITSILPSGSGGFLIGVVVFACVFKWVPQAKVHWRYAFIASVVTSIFWNIARLGFDFYSTHVLSYHKIYGTLGAIPIFLLWVYVIWVVVLGGAALTATLQKRHA